MSPLTKRRGSGCPSPSVSIGATSSPMRSGWVPLAPVTTMREPGDSVWRTSGTRWKNMLSPTGSRPIAARRSPMKRAARIASGVPVSRPRIESAAMTDKSRASAAASISSDDGRIGGVSIVPAAEQPSARSTTTAVPSPRLEPWRVNRCMVRWLGRMSADSFRIRFGSVPWRDRAVLYICIPVYNEAPTVGLVLWKLRKALQEYSREYEVVIYDDGSTDGTREALVPYADVLPLTIIGPKS